MGHEEWLSDPRFTTNKERLANKHALVPMLEEAFRTRNADEWVSILEREEIPVGVVNTLDRVMKDPQIRHRNMVLDLESGDGRKASVTGNPMKFKDTAPEAHDYPRALGADTAAVSEGCARSVGRRNRGTGAQQSRYRQRFHSRLACASQ